MDALLNALMAIGLLLVLILVIYLIDRVNAIEKETRKVMTSIHEKSARVATPFMGLSSKKLWDAMTGRATEGLDAEAIAELRNVWRFDDIFSSSVLMDFDKNSDLKLDHSELNEIANTIRDSLGDYSYFTFISKDGASSEIAKPEIFNVDFKDNQLLVFFVAKPKAPLKIGGRMTIGVYDPTLYTAIDFAKDEDMVVEGKAFAACTHKVVRPDPDEVIAQHPRRVLGGQLGHGGHIVGG